MKRKNRLFSSPINLEARQMLAGANIASGTFVIRNGEIVTGDVDLQGDAAIVGSVDGVEVINSGTTSTGATPPVRPTRSPSSSGTRSSSSRPSSSSNSSPANISSATIISQNGEPTVEDINVQGDATFTNNVTGEQVVGDGVGRSGSSSGGRPISSPSSSRPVSSTSTRAPATSAAQIDSPTSENSNLASGRFTVRNGEVLNQDVNLQGDAAIAGSINGEEIVNSGPIATASDQPASAPSSASTPAPSTAPIAPIAAPVAAPVAPVAAPVASAAPVSTATNGDANVASGRFVIRNDEVVSQDVTLQGDAAIEGSINGEEVINSGSTSTSADRPVRSSRTRSSSRRPRSSSRRPRGRTSETSISSVFFSGLNDEIVALDVQVEGDASAFGTANGEVVVDEGPTRSSRSGSGQPISTPSR